MRAVAERVSFDVLVVGSGASGLAAALSAERAGARVALVTKGSLQSCNSAKAQGGIQAAFGDDDSPEQHAEDVWQSSHETADRRLVEVLTAEAPGAIHWLEEQGVEFTRDNGGYRLAARAGSGCCRSAIAPAMRSQPRCATPTPPRAANPFRTARSSRLNGGRTAGSQPANARTATSS
jgi:succinate dehydrogenase/fumarate reductase flavoprotein subunit